VLSAINGSKNGSKFGRGEPFVWRDDFDVFEAYDVQCAGRINAQRNLEGPKLDRKRTDGDRVALLRDRMPFFSLGNLRNTPG
jgi:hypothetical protein